MLRYFKRTAPGGSGVARVCASWGGEKPPQSQAPTALSEVECGRAQRQTDSTDGNTEGAADGAQTEAGGEGSGPHGGVRLHLQLRSWRWQCGSGASKRHSRERGEDGKGGEDGEEGEEWKAGRGGRR